MSEERNDEQSVRAAEAANSRAESAYRDAQAPRREPGDDVSKRRTAFVQIVALEAAIITALWYLGRIFS